ncbi:MAG: antibiotic biosynthesis monooxygenase [Gammaproteobacteria bacterium]|nr:antibiotic biosynthesis monooxygenase [Gammaproteobacteria bacterium]
MIKVIIERVLAEDMGSTYDREIKKTLVAVMAAKGFISGTSYGDVNSPNIRTIITNWDNVRCWERWYQSQSRRDANKSIQLMLKYDEKVKILSPQALS